MPRQRGAGGGRGGPPRRKKRRERGRKRRSFFALFMSVILLAALGGGVYWGVGKVQDFFNAPDYTAVGTEEVTVEIKAGTITDTANALFEAGIVKSAKAYIKAAESDPRATNVQPGFYKLVKQMPAKEALGRLLNPEKYRVVNGVPIPEGMVSIEIFKLLSQKTGIPVANFTKAAKDPEALGVPDWWFKRGDGKKAAGGIEGFLYPATYEFPPNATAEDILKMMVNQFLTVTGDLKFADTVQANLDISPYEALIAASIAEEEAVFKEDFPKVTRVLYNRAYGGNFPCACLGLDSAINYYLVITGKHAKSSDKILQSEIDDLKNPYNTHKKPGLPPGPIANPGKETLQAAMAPAKGKWVYFMSIDDKGTMAYAVDQAGHDANIQLACKNGLDLC
ncbi:endolytic transglycosylase MltG [Luedemannella flava]